MEVAIPLVIACVMTAGAVAAGTTADAQPAEKPAPETGEQSPRPVLALVEHNPWLMVIGSDSPSFALYDDGTVIFLKRVGEPDATIRTVKLEAAEFRRLVSSLPLQALIDLPESEYTASSATDQTTTVVHTWRDGKRKSVSVYGDVRSGVGLLTRKAEKKESPEDHMLSIDVEGIPQPVLKTVERLIGFDHPRAERWLPREVEVMIWPYEYAPDESRPWPKEWPGLKDPKTRRRAGKSFSLYLPSTELEALRKFLARRREKQAILIDGKKWAVSIRLPFPSEREWLSARR